MPCFIQLYSTLSSQVFSCRDFPCPVSFSCTVLSALRCSPAGIFHALFHSVVQYSQLSGVLLQGFSMPCFIQLYSTLSSQVFSCRDFPCPVSFSCTVLSTLRCSLLIHSYSAVRCSVPQFVQLYSILKCSLPATKRGA